ncbi:LuxR family transcriptional regulator [Streptomyces sp. EN23]|uniref:helix-turn-helix transcriptional regulator n=1 Tax=Streptomyces sp. EN23 TaxID=212774 RepID=UPI000851B9B4|nr:LuxR family transcriptional regulator [Streptomyces sp. EN23]
MRLFDGRRRLLEPDSASQFLEKSFESSVAGAGRLVFISGGVGSGKTTLQSELLHNAAGSGALTLSATAAPDEQQINAAVLDQLLANSPLPIDIPDDPGTVSPDSGDESNWSAVPGRRQTDTRIPRRFCDALLGIARTRPLVIAIDDLHYADDLSLKLILQLQLRIRFTRMMVILSQPDWLPQTAQMRLSARFARQPHFHFVQLQPMSKRAVGSMLRESLDGAPGPDLPAQLHALGGGNPLLTTALVDDYLAGDRDGRPAVGPAYARAVHAFLDRPDIRLLETASAVAVLGDYGGTEMVAKLTGIDPDAVSGMMDALDLAGLLVKGQVKHPSTRAAILGSLAPGARSALHSKAAELKYWNAATPNEVASHLVAAGETPAAWAIPVLRHAAGQAMLSDDVQFATQCLELALTGSKDEDERRAIRQSLVHNTWRVNPSAVSAYGSSLREAAYAGTLDAPGCFALMRHALWHGDRETFARTQQVLSTLPASVDPQTEAELHLAYQWHFGPVAGTKEHADSGSHPGSALWDRTAAGLMQIWRGGGDETTDASAERILQNCRLSDTSLEALAMAIMALARSGRSDRAERWCKRLVREADQRGAVTWQAMLEGLRASILLQRGEVAVAAERARACLDMLGEHNWGVSIAQPLTVLLLADIARGSYDDAAKVLRRPVPEAMFATVGGLTYLRACGHFYLATKRPLAAVSEFQKCQQLVRDWDATAASLVPWRSDLAEANLHLGNTAMARDLARQQLDLSAEKDPYGSGLALRVLAQAGPPGERSALFARAAESFQALGDQLEVDRTVRMANKAPRSGTAPRTGRPGDQRWPAERRSPGEGQKLTPRGIPAQPLGSGRAPARPVGAPARSAPAARTERSAAPGSKPSETHDATVLSEAEQRVAQLAALDHTNRQISSRLFITVSTVEQHLTRAYKKLGISGRSTLSKELWTRYPQLMSSDESPRSDSGIGIVV